MNRLLKILFLLWVFLATGPEGQSQSLRKYPISNSGCSIYSYCESKFDVDYSEDSSKVYTGECTSGEVTYGVICIQLLNPITDLQAAEDMMISYLDYLKISFDIKKSAGYGKGHQLPKNENTRGVIDYWEDKQLDKWKVKSWTDGKYIGFMYAYSKKDLPENKVNLFLDGFKFPGMK